MAHRDDTGRRARARTTTRRGTAALVELARGYALPGTPAGSACGPRTRSSSSRPTAARSAALGALRFAAQLAVPRRRGDQPRRDRRQRARRDRDRRRRAALAGGEPRRDGVATHRSSRRAAAPAGRLRRAADRPRLPVHALRAGAVRRARHPGASRSRRREHGRPSAFTDRRRALSTAHGSAQIGRAAQELVGSLDQGLELAQGTTSFVWAGSRFVRGWAIELVLDRAADPVPRRRRRPVRALPAAADPALAGGAQPAQPARGSGSSPALAFYALPRARRVADGRAAAAEPGVARRRRLARRSRCSCSPSSRSSAGSSRGSASCRAGRRARGAARRRDRGAARARRRRVARSGNKPVRADLLPARAARVALAAAGAERRSRPRARVLLVARPRRAGADRAVARAPLRARVRRALVPARARRRSGTCTCPLSRSRSRGAACAAQLAAVTAGRYAPYPHRGERPPRGPLRELVRASRARADA